MHARTALALPTLVAALALPAAAEAATTVGSDLSPTPSAACADVDANVKTFHDCTATQLDGATYAVPSSGVITRWSLRHGPEVDGDIPVASLRILTPGAGAQTFTARIASGLGNLSSAAATDTFSFSDDYGRPNGVPVSAGDRIGVYVNDGGLAILGAGAGQTGIVRGSANGAATFDTATGSLLLQAVVEPDADADGYGDETQDACPQVAGPGACPGATPPSAGTTPTTPPSSTNPGGGTIPLFVAPTIEAFHAEEIAVYHAATIQRLPSHVNLYDAVLRGFSQPIRCSLACQITTAATMRGISASLYAMMARSRTVTVGRSSGAFPTAGSGRLRLKLTAKASRALRTYGRTVKVMLRTTVKDGRKTVARTQTITLKPTQKRKRR